VSISRQNNILRLSSSSRHILKVSDDSPFEVLGIPKTANYKEVKRRFVELALANHPDISKDANSSNFIRFRKAFESIQESHDGGAKERESRDSSGWTDEEFQAWFYSETGHQDVHFGIDLATRKEVIHVANSQSQGGLDRGGMWEMARVMAEQENNLRNKKMDFSPSVGIDAGEKPVSSPRRRSRR
jgi:DnaJ-class molecular chaperone